MIKDAWSKNHQVFLVGAQGKVKERLHKMKLLHRLPSENCFQERLFALQKAIALIETPSPIILDRNSASSDSHLS